jgi:hypothetical protein
MKNEIRFNAYADVEADFSPVLLAPAGKSYVTLSYGGEFRRALKPKDGEKFQVTIKRIRKR